MTSLYETGEKDATPKNPESQAPQDPPVISAPPDSADGGENATIDGAENAPATVTLADITGVHTSAMDGFDPSRHALDSEGNPRKKRDGSFALKRGRKGGGVVSDSASQQVKPNTSGKLPPKPAPSLDRPGTQPDAPAPVNYKAMATAAASTVLGVAVMTMGDEWRPKDKAEFSGLVDAGAAYMEAQGVTDIPPGWLLLSVVAAYSLPRITQPTTKSRLMAGWLKIKGLFARKKSVVAGE